MSVAGPSGADAPAPETKPTRASRRVSGAVVVRIRRQGGARVVTLPPALLASIGADAGTALALAVKEGALVATPVADPAERPRRRYRLAELLEGAEHLPALYAGTAGALGGPPVGDEIG